MDPKSTPKSPQSAPKGNNKKPHEKGRQKELICREEGRVDLKLAGDGKRKVCERWACSGDVFVVAAFC